MARWMGAAGIIAVCALAGCTPGETGKPVAPSKPVAGKKLRIAGIIFQEDQFFRMVRFGMHDGAAKNNVEILDGNSNNHPEKEIELVNTYIAQNVDAIIISPLSKTGSVAALKLAKQKGIVVIANNTPIDGDAHAAYIESDAYDLGVQTGTKAREYIEKKLGGKAKIAIVEFKSLIPEQSNARTGGFKSEMAKLPGVQIVADQDAWLPEKAVSKVSDILTAHPDVDLIWSANEGGTIGAVMAVKNAGKAGKVAVFGTDSSMQLVDFLLSPDDILQAITSQKPVESGQMAVEFALKVKRGEPVEKKVSMKGILLSRDDAEGVKAFRSKLQEWTGSK